jgi:hypothetical protein
MPRGSIGSPPERGAGVYADRSETYQTRSGHVSTPDLMPGCVLSWDLGTHCGWLGHHTGGGGGPDPIPGLRSVHVGVLDQPWRFGLHIQRSGTLPWGSGPIFDGLERVTFSGHVATPDLAHVAGSGAVVDPEQSPEAGASHGLVPHTALLPRD